MFQAFRQLSAYDAGGSAFHGFKNSAPGARGPVSIIPSSTGRFWIEVCVDAIKQQAEQQQNTGIGPLFGMRLWAS